MENLEVLQICVFGIDVKLDPGHWHVEVDAVKDLAESGTAVAEVVSKYWQPGVIKEGQSAGRSNLLTQFHIAQPL